MTKPATREEIQQAKPATRIESRVEKNKSNTDIFSRTTSGTPPKDDFFSRELKTNKIVDQGIPVIKNNKLDSEVVKAEKTDANDTKVFPDIKLDKKATIFPELPEINKSNSFFDEDEFNDLNDYMENDNKNGWF